MKPLPPLTNSQTELLEILWDRGESTVSDVWAALQEKREIARNTVQTMLTRLFKKGWLKRRAIGKTFLFQAAVHRSDAQSLLAGRMVDSLFKGSTERLVMTLLEHRGVDDEEARKIRAMLDSAPKQEKK